MRGDGYQPAFCLPACLLCLPACLPVCVSVCLPACLPACLSICLCPAPPNPRTGVREEVEGDAPAAAGGEDEEVGHVVVGVRHDHGGRDEAHLRGWLMGEEGGGRVVFG